jgi:hypothetical protein
MTPVQTARYLSCVASYIEKSHQPDPGQVKTALQHLLDQVEPLHGDRLAAEILRFAAAADDEVKDIARKSEDQSKPTDKSSVKEIWETDKGRDVKEKIQDLSSAERVDKVQTALKSLMHRIPAFLQALDTEPMDISKDVVMEGQQESPF